MPDIGTRFRATGLAPDFVVVDAVSGPVTAGELAHLAVSRPVGMDADAVVGMRFADPADLARALFLLDGKVAAMVQVPMALDEAQVASLGARTGMTHLIDRLPEAGAPLAGAARVATRWVLATSGTTGTPKAVHYSFPILARAIRPPRPGKAMGVWGLLLDPTRFAGNQTLLQGLLGGGRLAVPSSDVMLPQRVAMLARAGCNYLTATPSLWRRMLMSPEVRALPLRRVQLVGEIADQPLLSALARAFPDAQLVHVYGSTEAGVGFGVADGLAGFPAVWLENPPPGLGMKIVDGLLWVRPETAPTGEGVESDDEGFIRTGDRVALEGDRFHFLGREGTAINVGGVKVQPEQVEGVLRAHPQVADCRVGSRRSPVVGALVVAEVVPVAGAGADFRAELKRWCRERLTREAQPATITLVDAVEVTAAGKLARVLVA